MAVNEDKNEENSNNQSNNEDDMTEDDFVFEEEGESSTDTIKKLRDQLKVCTNEKREYLDGWQRAKADLVNARKRFASERTEASARANERLLEDLLPVVDSFEMAFSAKAWEEVDQQWRVGVEHIHKELINVLNKSGVNEIAPIVGEELDPEYHEPVETVSTNDAADNDTVAALLQKGYVLNDRVLRPAKVSVYKVEDNSSQ